MLLDLVCSTDSVPLFALTHNILIFDPPELWPDAEGVDETFAVGDVLEDLVHADGFLSIDHVAV